MRPYLINEDKRPKDLVKILPLSFVITPLSNAIIVNLGGIFFVFIILLMFIYVGNSEKNNSTPMYTNIMPYDT